MNGLKPIYLLSGGSINSGKGFNAAELFPCLGIISIICDTHGEQEDWEELQAALRLKRGPAIGYGITTASCIKVFPNGKLEVLGGAVARYRSHGDELKRLSDSLPYS